LNQWEHQRSELCQVCLEMYRRSLVSAYSGNASLRLERTGREGLLLVTPTHHPYYRLQPEELVVVNLEGEPVGESSLKPSSETRLHLEIYKQRDDVGAVVHTHSIYASVAAVADREIPPIIDEMILTLGGSVRIGDYALPGTHELALVAARALGDRNAALLRNHGVVGVGPDIWEALEVCDLVERLARIFVLSQAFGPGGANLLPPDVVELEQQLFQNSRLTKDERRRTKDE
jgi:ribulose-5-phosphate 4-epimerase/fuculose-1-phosphate aldolase